MNTDFIREQIGKTEINQAIQNMQGILRDYLPDDIEIRDSLFLQQNEYSDLTKKNLKGLIAEESVRITQNQIVDSLLKILIVIDNSLKAKKESEEKTSKPDDENWRKFSELKQIKLAQRGKIQISDPRDFTLYFYNKYGELLDKHTFGGQLHYIALQKAKAEAEINPETKRLLLSTVCALYEELENLAIENPLSPEKERKDSLLGNLLKMIIPTKRLPKYSEEDRIKIRNLKDESHEYYNFYARKLSSEQYEQAVARENEKALKRLKQSLNQSDREIDEVRITIPGMLADWFFSGYLWYEYGFPRNHPEHWHFEKGDWVKYGDLVVTVYDIPVRSPINGVFLGRVYDSSRGFWSMVPQKDYKISDTATEFIFGELIDTMHYRISNGREWDKYPKNMLLEALQELTAEKLTINEWDVDTRDFFQKSKA